MKTIHRILALVITSFIILSSCGGGGSNTTEAIAEKVVMPENYSLVSTWSSEYKSNKFTLEFKADMTGTFLVEGQEGSFDFTWEEERPSENRINVTIIVKNKSEYNKESLHMFNAGWGFSLKLEYIAKDEFKMYNGLFLKDGKLAKDDGRVILKQSQ